LRPINRGAPTGDLTYTILAIGIALVLVFSAISTIATIGLSAAFAEKGGSGGGKGNSSSDHGNGDKSKGQQGSNQTTSTNSTNSTDSDAEDDDNSKKGKDKGNENHYQSVKPAWEERLNQTADEIHEKHLKMNAGFSGPYTANMTYTFNANGTAYAIGNSSYAGDVQLSLDMSVWKSRPTQVQLDVTGGELTVDGQSMEVHSGHAHYWSNTNRMLIIAFVVEGGNVEDTNDGNQTSTITNQTSTTNQTSSIDDTIESEDDEGVSEPQIRVLKLWITIPEETNGLPTSESPNPIDVDIMSPQSKLASMWFMEMDGEVALSP
jgi:hypothetical protein